MQTATTGSNIQSVSNTSFAATVENTNQGVVVNKMVNNFSNLSQVELKFTASGAAAAVSTISLLPGSGKGAVTALPAGVTVSGDITTWADWIDFIKNNDCFISKIWMQSADTGNYAGRLTVGYIMPNGKTPFDTYKQLSDYKVSTGNGYAEEINITDLKLVTKPNLFMKFDIKQSTEIRVILTIPAMNVSADVAEVKY